jgi:DHA2 family multidrug resistance protein
MVYKHPIVNLNVLKDGNLRIGTFMTFILGFGLYGSTLIIPIYTQQILGWTATQAGVLLIPGSVATAFMMPIVGNMIQKGIRQQYLVAIGFIVFFFFTLWMHNIMTPDTGKEQLYWPLILRGIGLSLLFVPITTMALSTLKGKNIGEGAAFTGMTRQLGGSFGIAIITTYITRLSQEHRVNLVSHLDASKFEVQQRVAGMQQAFAAKGYAANESLGKAYQALDYTVMKQATVMSYMDIFLYLGILFLICVPVILLVKKGKNKVDPNEALH